MPEVSVITVQYGNVDDTVGLISSLAAVDRANEVELIIVDNSANHAASHSIDALTRPAPFPIRCMRAPRNLYYWGGAAFAIDAIRAESPMFPRWIVICNNDITFSDSAFLRSLLAIDHDRFPIVAPSIVSTATGLEQNPLLESPPPFLKRLKWRVYDMNYLMAKAMLAIHGVRTSISTQGRAARDRQTNSMHSRPIYAPHGACVALSSKFFESGGSLDTTVPMFAEELTLAEAARALSMPITYVRSLRVQHREHSTTGSDLSPEKYEMERSARAHYFSIVSSRPIRH